MRLKDILPTLLAFITQRPRYEIRYGVNFEWSDKSWTHNFFRTLELIFGYGGASKTLGDTIYPSIATGYVNVANTCGPKTTFVRQAFTFEATIALIETEIREFLTTFKLPKYKHVYIPVLAPAGFRQMPSLLGLPYMFAIAVDATSHSTNSCSGDNTVSHTNTGSNIKLVIGIGTNTTSTNDITGVTYAGSAATAGPVDSGGTPGCSAVYYKDSPATGANNIVVGLGGTSNCWYTANCSYTGCATGLDSQNSGRVTSNQANFSLATTVVASNCWLSGYWGNNGCVGIAGVGTQRALQNNSAQLIDSNGTVSTGSQSLRGDCSSSSAQWTASMVSIAPYVASGPANLKSYNTNLKANIKSICTNLIANVKSLNTNA